MFLKGVITDEISQDFQTAVELAMKYNLDGVEIRSVWEKGPHELSKQQIDEICRILKAAGLGVPCISAPFFKCDLDDPQEIECQMNILVRSIGLAHRVGAGFIRGFTFWRKGPFDQELLDRITARFDGPLKLLEAEGMTLVLESDPSVNATNAAKLAQVIQRIHSHRVKALWDPGNDLYDPDGEIPYPDGYALIKPHIAHIHLKDARRQQDGTAAGTPIGEGQVGYREHLKRLIEDGYGGYVVLETHYRPRHQIDEALLALPKGSAFSWLGREATEECLLNWQNILSELSL